MINIHDIKFEPRKTATLSDWKEVDWEKIIQSMNENNEALQKLLKTTSDMVLRTVYFNHK